MAKKRKPQRPTRQTIVRHHSDWMRLIERSGPFLSMPVLLDIFPQGLSKDDRERRVPLRDAYETWQTDNHDIAVHRAWIKYVLTQALEIPEEHIFDAGHIPTNLSVRVDVHHETLTPDMALIEPEDNDENQPAIPRMIVMIVPPDQALDKKLPGKTWPASPQTRMSDLVRGCNDQGITFGLLTNGEKWMLVYSKQGETASFTTWYASIWFDEKVTLRAFRDLLSARRFYGDPDRTLDKLFERSADDQHEVTDQLGLQVRDAIETLVYAIDEIDRDRKRKLLKGFSEEQLYESCVTVMMRLVFLFFAEERRLLPVNEPFYEQNYSLHGLLDRLQSQKASGEEIMEQELSGWCRLLALFRAIHGGVQHDDMRLHAYGSSLFDPDRFPFLEGRTAGTKWRELEAQPLPINDRTLLHVLEALKMLEVRGIGGGQRITRIMSFRELDVEDIGHIYESLLDHTAKRAKGHVLGLVGSKGKEPELSLAELEMHAENSREALVKYLKDETGKTIKTIEKLLDAETKIDESRLLAACGNDQAFLTRVKPFANLVRENRSGDPIIIPDGSVYVTEGTDRRSSGTHYTPKSLTEPIVQHTLEPLVYEGPAEGKPQDEWKLKSPAEILELNICDMACGSGAFLVQACRYMAERLVEAWEHIERTSEALADDSQTDTGNIVVGTVEADQFVVEKNGQYALSKTVRRPRITPLGEVSKSDPSEELIPLDPTERMIYARRIVADRCLYGVDINPLATEMAKLSLWLLTLAKDKPFTFLNHAIRPGDSLVGLNDIEQLRHFSLMPDAEDAILFSGPIEDSVDDAIKLRIQLEGMPTKSILDVESKTQLLVQSGDKLARMRCASDLLISAEYWNERKSDINEAIRHAAVVSGYYVERGPTNEFESKAKVALDGQRTFHWPLEFPEVFEEGGFHAFIGNPPFITGTSISTILGKEYKRFLKKIWCHAEGRADICVMFMLQASILLRNDGCAGFIGTDSTSEGDSRTTGPAFLLQQNRSIYRAVKRQKWPGSAQVKICQCYFSIRDWSGDFVLDGSQVEGITSGFDAGEELPEPFTLKHNKSLSFTGTKVYGEGFVLSKRAGLSLLDEHPSYSSVVKPYMIGKELNSISCEPGRYVIDFTDMSETDAKKFRAPFEILLRDVKDERQDAPEKKMREQWWKFQRPRKALYKRLRDTGHGWLIAATSDTVAFVAIEYSSESPVIFSHALNILALNGFGDFAVAQSTLHLSWARKYGSSMKGDMRYTTTDCFETFPFPESTTILSKTGKQYYETRRSLSKSLSLGYTKLYEHVHNAKETSSEFKTLRKLQVSMDNEVLAAYGWKDVALDHGFYSTQFGERFTIHDTARRELLKRMLYLNHSQHKPKNDKAAPPKKPKEKVLAAATGLLFDPDEG